MFKNFPLHPISFPNILIELVLLNIIGLVSFKLYSFLIVLPILYWLIRLGYFAYRIFLYIVRKLVNKILLEHRLIELPKTIQPTKLYKNRRR